MSGRQSRTSVISPLMQKVSAYIASSNKARLPPEVIERGKHHLLDGIAAMVSGSRLRAGRKAIEYARSVGGKPEALIVGTRIMTSAVTAAMLNGVLAHADETDDSHVGSGTHPGCAIVPAALAVAERERSSGLALLRAVILGYDVGCRMNLSLGPLRIYGVGHATHSIGTAFGAAAAASALFGLDSKAVRHVLSYTAQQASGIATWMRDPDHVEKAFDFGGMGARNGVTAASLVAHGWTGVDDIFSGDRNFYHAFDAERTANELVEKLGRRFEIMNTQIKKWTVGAPIQSPLNSTASLIQQYGIKAADVEEVIVTIGDRTARHVDNRANPDTCLQYLVALMLIDGAVTFASAHDAKRFGDPKIIAMRRRIRLQGVAKFERLKPPRQAIVEIKLRNGRRFRHHTVATRGMPDNPMSRAEMEDKTMDLMAPVLGASRARKVVDSIWSIEKVADVRRMRALLTK